MPNNITFCRCADLRDGTHKCNDEGTQFSDCACDGAIQSQQSSQDQHLTEHPTQMATVDSDADTCPGKAVSLDPGPVQTVTGDTSTAVANYAPDNGVCAVATGKERVYEVIPTQSGKMTAKLVPGFGFDGTLYVRDDACNTGALLVCAESAGASGTETATLNVVAGHKYYVFADGKGDSSGTYGLELKLEAGGFCGDGTVAQGEECDDGNNVPMDGCSDTCTPEGDPVVLGQCSGASGGMPVHLWGASAGDIVIDGSTIPFPNLHSSANCSFGQNAQDRVYHIIPHAAGLIDIQLSAQFNAGIYLHVDSCDTGTEPQNACSNNAGTSMIPNIETINNIDVVDGADFWLFVDGAIAYKGTFELTIRMHQ